VFGGGGKKMELAAGQNQRRVRFVDVDLQLKKKERRGGKHCFTYGCCPRKSHSKDVGKQPLGTTVAPVGEPGKSERLRERKKKAQKGFLFLVHVHRRKKNGILGHISDGVPMKEHAEDGEGGEGRKK